MVLYRHFTPGYVCLKYGYTIGNIDLIGRAGLLKDRIESLIFKYTEAYYHESKNTR